MQRSSIQAPRLQYDAGGVAKAKQVATPLSLIFMVLLRIVLRLQSRLSLFGSRQGGNFGPQSIRVQCDLVSKGVGSEGALADYCCQLCQTFAHILMMYIYIETCVRDFGHIGSSQPLWAPGLARTSAPSAYTRTELPQKCTQQKWKARSISTRVCKVAAQKLPINANKLPQITK